MGIDSSSKGDETPSPPALRNGKGEGKDDSGQSSDHYEVYRAEYHGNPNHVAVFIETHEGGLGSGFLYHVEGNILQGMVYRPKRAQWPTKSPLFVPGTKVLIGRVAVTNYRQVDTVCQTIPPPGKQMNLGGKRLDPNKPLRDAGNG